MGPRLAHTATCRAGTRSKRLSRATRNRARQTRWGPPRPNPCARASPGDSRRGSVVLRRSAARSAPERSAIARWDLAHTRAADRTRDRQRAGTRAAAGTAGTVAAQELERRRVALSAAELPPGLARVPKMPNLRGQD